MRQSLVLFSIVDSYVGFGTPAKHIVGRLPFAARRRTIQRSRRIDSPVGQRL
jgi:hypothetical protein